MSEATKKVPRRIAQTVLNSLKGGGISFGKHGIRFCLLGYWGSTGNLEPRNI